LKQKALVYRQLKKLVLESRQSQQELTMWLSLKKNANQVVIQAPNVMELHRSVLKVRVMLQQEHLEGHVSF
jgi:sRNA-binding carbon storage regulator CsrA